MKKIFTTSIVTITICFLLLLFKNQYSCMLLTNSTYGMPALIKQGSVENLYLGSSMFRQGIDINVLEESSDFTNYILAYNGNQPALEYYELKYLLEQNVQITNLYIDMYVYSAWEEPEISDEKLFMEVGIPEKWNLWRLITPTIKDNYFQILWRFWVNSNNELLLTWPISSPIINSQFHNGGTLTKTDSASYDALSQTSAPAISDKMNSTQEYYIKELIRLAQEHHINLVFIETPKYESIANDVSYLTAMKQYAQLLSENNTAYIVSENTQQKCQLNEALSYSFNHSETRYYMDTMHLSYDGRVAFTTSFLNPAPFFPASHSLAPDH